MSDLYHAFAYTHLLIFAMKLEFRSTTSVMINLRLHIELPVKYGEGLHHPPPPKGMRSKASSQFES
jgi:hypothetical protein